MDNIIKFKSDTAFRKRFFVPKSFSHPAKMSAPLLIWIVEHFTSEGETILDPMFGSGTTMLACTLGRNVIGVELESKFCDMAKQNWEVVKMHPQLGSAMGTCQILQGDARNLEGLLCDKIVTSPPYAEVNQAPRDNPDPTADKSARANIGKAYSDNPSNIGNLPYGDIDKCIFSPPFKEQMQDTNWMRENQPREHRGNHNPKEQNPSNIANLPYGNIDGIITSPPYEGIESRDRSKEDWWDEEREKKMSGGSAKIAKGYQADTIITSPPYEEAMGEKHHSPRAGKLAEEKSNPVTYTDKVDSIITSPPYEGSLQGDIEDKISAGFKSPEAIKILQSSARGYSKSEDNIGNLKSDSYLEAMSQVYSQCYKVLKPQGLMVLVTKNFLRKQKEVRLDLDTIRLCEQSGFTFKERWYRQLPAQSFWRVIYRKKFPNAPVLKFEDVLVFAKGEV